jgi:hypothetical protein
MVALAWASHQIVEALFIRDHFWRWHARFELGKKNTGCRCHQRESNNLGEFLRAEMVVQRSCKESERQERSGENH